MKKIALFIVSLCLFCNIFFINSYASSSREFFEQGVRMLQQGKHQEAVGYFTQSIQLDPGNAKTFKNRGVSYMKLKKNDLAIEDFEKAAAINPELKGLYSNLGAAWYQKKNFQKAVFYYDKEISLDTSQYIFYFNRALANASLKNYAKAIEDLSFTLELKPDFYWGLCFKGDMLVKTGKLSEAKENYAKALEKHPEKKYAQQQLDNLQTINKSKNNIGGKFYTVQVGAFLVQTNAEKMVKRLLDQGYDTWLFEFKKSDGTILHIVRVGKFADKKEAQKILESIKNRLGINAIIKLSDKV
ncbi:MAG: tetratricopeptide repeat protein [Desulfobacteraceae bacterium]|nr:tetratricopeptide repeat protein [Desulfobacteraceae bacterium]